MAADLERFLALVKRELACDEAQVTDAPAGGSLPDPADALVIAAQLPDGRMVRARFGAPPVDAEAKARRLDMLISTFDDLIEEVPERRSSRPPVASSLHDELSAVCARSVALNAVVIDANSPIIWGAAHRRGLVSRSPDDSAIVGVEEPANDGSPLESRILLASRRALRVVRGWEDLAALRRGKRLRRIEREGPSPLVAHSFAGIYVLLLVFDAAFDELRAERSALEALPRIERLVLALPPLDPEPSHGAGAMAVKRPPKR